MLLTIDQITAGYGHAPVLTDVSMEVAAGEIVCIIGPNGAGKSTVLRTAAGQLIPSKGPVRRRTPDPCPEPVPSVETGSGAPG